jgi:hypothetical protein
MALFNLPPGIPALILLFLMITIAVISGIRSSTNERRRVDKEGLLWFLERSPAKVRAIATATVALPFWMWAVYKYWMNGDPDLGAITFLLVMISCAVTASNTDGTSMVVSSAMLLCSNILLTLNYFYPVYAFDLPATFNLYLVTAGLVWIYMSVWNWKGRHNTVEDDGLFSSSRESERIV